MSAETALREDLGRFLRRVGGLTVEFRDGKAFLPVRDDWVGDLEAGYRAALSAHRVEPAPTLDVERAAIERVARLRDARDALDMATLWLHRTMDLPPRDSQAAASWERKARSGRVALAADTPPSDAPEEATR